MAFGFGVKGLLLQDYFGRYGAALSRHAFKKRLHNPSIGFMPAIQDI
jgi:hypothetical protein